MKGKFKCHWFANISEEWHETECGKEFQFFDGDWKENGFKFCPYCGRRIEGKKRKEAK